MKNQIHLKKAKVELLNIKAVFNVQTLVFLKSRTLYLVLFILFKFRSFLSTS